MQMSNVAICLLVFGANFLLIYKMHDSLDVEIPVSIYLLLLKRRTFSPLMLVTKKFNFKFNLRRAELQYWKSLGSITIPHGRVVILVNVLVMLMGWKVFQWGKSKWTKFINWVKTTNEKLIFHNHHWKLKD